MEKWRRKGGDKYNNQEFRRIKSNNNNHCYRRKPPLGVASNYQGAVPYWEKRFVSSVGSLSWDHFLEAQKFTYLYDNIKEWDDAAGEEAFRIAKDRFYAKFYGHPCDVEQQNPDLYIDEIDWNAEVDYNLMLDFDSEPVVPDVDSNHEPVLDFGDVLPDPYKDYSPYGWGDSDDKINNSWGISKDMNKDQGGTNWDDYINNGRINWDSCDIGGANNDWWDWNENDNKAGDQGCNGYVNNSDHHPTYGNVHNESYMSSHKMGNFHGNNSRHSHSWRSNRSWRKPTGQSYGSQHEPVLDFGDVLPDPHKDYSPYGWGDSDDKIKNSWGTSNDMNKDQGGINWDDCIDNGRINWDGCDVGGANNDWWDWNENDNKTGDQGYNGYVNNNDYYPTYGNVHNERYKSSHKTGSFHGNNGQRSRSWRNNGSWRKTTGQNYGSQHGHWSSFQSHGSQRIHVHP